MWISSFTLLLPVVCLCVYIAQHNAAAAALNRNQELSAAAPEFIPNFKPTPNPSGDWNYQAHHQDTSQVYQPPQHIYPAAAQNHSRPFQQQANFQRNYPVYPQQQQQSNRNYRPDLIQNHHSHHHHQNYSNHHQQQQQSQSHYMMMNQQQQHQSYPQQQQQQGQQGQGHDGYGMSSIQNRLNFNNSHPPEPAIPHEPVPHKQVSSLTF